MQTGTIKKLVHLSQQTSLPNARLVADHNDKGYGIIQSEDGREVYFRHDVVESRYGFDDLRRGQGVEYTLEATTYLRAVWVKPVASPAARLERRQPAA
jgi:cold shock CspA family protein